MEDLIKLVDAVMTRSMATFVGCWYCGATREMCDLFAERYGIDNPVCCDDTDYKKANL